MIKIFAAATSILLFTAAVNSQTATDLAKKYRHYEVYEVQPGVQMTPKFDSSGLVCEMQVEPVHFVNNGVDMSRGIDERKVYPIIDQLVPVSERGTKLSTFDECVGVCQTTYQYSNVAIMIVSAGDARLVRIKWHNRSCE